MESTLRPVLVQPRPRLALPLALVAGYVDAVGFLGSGGFFVSFMSGNSTRAGVGLGRLDWRFAAAGAGLVAAFVLGVILGASLGRRVRRRLTVLLLAEAGLLAVAACLDRAGSSRAALGMAAVAMGLENTLFERGGEVSFGLTYMTGTLVKTGLGLAEALRGEGRWRWVSPAILWSALLTGATLGGFAHDRAGLQALWAAVAVLAALAAICGARR